MRTERHLLGLRLFFIIFGCFSPQYVIAMDAEDAALQSLCRNGLTTAAVQYAATQRKLSESDTDRYARWTMRMMECEAQAGLRGGQSAPEHWDNCDRILAGFKQEHPRNRREPWLNWQAARCRFLNSQSTLSQWLAAPAKSEIREQTLETVRKILSDLDAVVDDIKVRLPIAGKLGPNDQSQAPTSQLADLRVDVVLLRCEALLVRSQLYESGSRDRIAAASEVEQNATSILDSASDEWTSRDNLEVARAAAWLELSRIPEALTVLKKYAQFADDQATRTRAATIAIESLVAKNQLNVAADFLGLLRKVDDSPDRYLAEIRLQVAVISRKPKDQVEQLMTAVLELSKQLGERFGDYWRWRAESILVGTVSSDQLSAGAAMELLTAEVKQLVAGGKEQEAIEKLTNSARNELALKHADNAVQLALLAGALMERRKEYSPACDLLESVAVSFPDHPVAAKAHLQAIRMAVAALRADVKKQTLQTRYLNLLEQQILKFPESSETGDAVQWLKDWQIGRDKAFELARVFRTQAERCGTSEAMSRALYEWLCAVVTSRNAGPRPNTPNPSSRVDEANTIQGEIDALQKRFLDGKLKAAETRGRVVILAARSLTQWTEAKSADETRRNVRQWTRDGKQDEIEFQLLRAVGLIEAIRMADINEAATLAKNLETDQLPLEAFASIARNILEAVDGLSTDSSPPWISNLLADSGQLIALENSTHPRYQAIALRWRCFEKARYEESVAKLRELGERNSRDVELQLMVATGLASKELKLSTEMASRVAASTAKGSDLFFAARWLALRNQLKSGEKEAAQQAAQLLVATYKMQPLWQARFSAIAGK
jgi:hypothetical protein